MTFEAGAGPTIERASLVEGVGGAGLYSDGKFSFRPSATRLWELQPSETLLDAEMDFAKLFEAHGGQTPRPVENPAPSTVDGEYRRKVYPSIYLSLDDRIRMIQSLVDESEDPIKFGTRVTKIAENDGVYALEAGGASEMFDGLVVATGRLGNVDRIGPAIELRRRFRRYELGVRIEAPADAFPLDKFDSVDPKLIGDGDPGSPGVSWRTFCVCRDGEVEPCKIETGGVLYSGRADCPPSGKSNFGLLVRVEDSTTAASWQLDAIVENLVSHDTSLQISYAEALETDFREITALLGPNVAKTLRAAIELLFRDFPRDRRHEVRLYGPCLEGVGDYPELSDDLSIPFGATAYAVGDCGGSFRGLVAALVSGYFGARQLAAGLR